jgi:hypothetical protein
MWKAFIAAIKYRGLLVEAIDFAVFVRAGVHDGKLDSSERYKILKYMWGVIKEAEALDKAHLPSTRTLGEPRNQGE